jgi:hypothetical protein
MVTQQEYDDATKRGDKMYEALPRAIGVRFDANTRTVVVELNRGYSISFSPERAQDLQNATVEDLSEVEVSGPGWGIYFPRIDADLRVPAMVNGRFGNDRWEAAWAEAHPQDKAA